MRQGTHTIFDTPYVGCVGEGMRLLIIAQPWRACSNWATRAPRQLPLPSYMAPLNYTSNASRCHTSCLSQAIKTRAPWKRRLQMMKYRRPSWLLISFPRKLSTHLLETRREFVESAPGARMPGAEPKMMMIALRVAAAETNFALSICLLQITKLKIDSNPFAKGFRDSSRLTEFER